LELKRQAADAATRKVPIKSEAPPETVMESRASKPQVKPDSTAGKADRIINAEVMPDAAVGKAEVKAIAPPRAVKTASSGTHFLLIIFGICSGLMLVSMAFLFKKMGLNPLAGAIPIYNLYLLLREFDRPEIWNVYLYIPFVNLYFGYLLAIDFVRRFGKSDRLGMGLVFLPIFFLPYLAFGPDRYLSNYGKESTDFGPDFDLRELSRIMASRMKEGKGVAPRKNKGTRDSKSSKEQPTRVGTGQTMDIGLGTKKKSG
jgi:hypothetical protein